MYPMKSSLNRERVNSLPEVYHRPQVGGGVINQPYNRDNERFETREHQGWQHENPARNLMRDFENLEIDSQTVCKRFVVAYNHQHRKDVGDFLYAKNAYLEMLGDFNLCWKCKHPIKVQKGSLVRKYENGVPVNPTMPGKPTDTVIGKVAMFPTSEHDVFVNRMRKSSVSANNKNAPWQGWKHEFKSVQFKGERKETTDVYAVIKSHYEVFQTADGRLEYRWIDGTGRNIQARRKELTFRVKGKKFGKSRNVTKKRHIQVKVHVLKNGTEYDLKTCPCNTCKGLKNPMPIEYHVPHLECKCKDR